MPTEKVEMQSSKQLVVEAPKLDLYPPHTFQSLYGKTIAESGLPMITIPRAASNLPPLTGVLVYATSFNVPYGCYRVSSQEVFGADLSSVFSRTAD